MIQTRVFKVSDLQTDEIIRLARAVEHGAVAVLPTDTVDGIGTGAYQEESIHSIYALKKRPATSPLQLLAGNSAQVRQAAIFGPQAEKLATCFWPGALTMILPPAPAGKSLARGFAGLGFRVPGNPFLVQFLQAMSVPMACTSANLHGQAVITDEKILLDTFDGKVDYIFLSGTLSPQASSVVDLMADPLLLREGAISRATLEQTLGVPLRVK